jgi:Fur family ferric uptake transcriptional regulator
MSSDCCKGGQQPWQDITARLRKGAKKITGPRQAVLQALRSQDHPLSPKEIFQALPAGECDLVTVYRSLALLQEMGMVKRFDFGDNVARYELLAEGDDGHHHHLVCTKCAQVLEIGECGICELEKRIAAQHGFQTVTHRLEFFGVCPACQRSA